MMRTASLFSSIFALLVLAGCLASQPPAPEAANPAQQAARPPTRILEVSAREESRGTHISVKADGPLTHRLYQKSDPPRILLIFPKTPLDHAIQPRLVNLATVAGLFPGETPEHDGQLELTLPAMLEYDLKETSSGLELTVLAPKRQESKNRPEIRDTRITRVTEGSEIRFLGTGPFPEPKIFRTEDPPRMVVDLPGIPGPGEPKSLTVSTPEVLRAQLASAPGKTRLVVDLAHAGIAYRLDRDAGGPFIQLTLRPDVAGTPSVTQVTFARDGADALTRIQLDREGFATHGQRQGNALTVQLKKTKAAEKWIRRMDVRAFGGPVEYVDLKPEGDNLQATLHLNRSAGPHDILQKDRELLIRVKSAATNPDPNALSEFPYAGQKVSLDVKEIDIQNALRFMAEVAKINIILADSVTGTLTMRLEEVPWDQALDLMLEAKQLGKVRQGNVLRIAPLEEIQKSAKARIVEQNNQKQLEPVVTEMIPVSFAQAEKIQTLLQEGDQAKGTRILSEQGSVALDQRTNTLIVKEVAGNLAQIRELVGKLDHPIPQVLIEARIVEVSRDNAASLGINWGFNYKKNDKWALSSGISNANEAHTVSANTSDSPRLPMTASPPMNFPFMPAAPGTPGFGSVGLHLGTLSPMLDLDIELGAMENTGKLTAIASPRILTTNKQKAVITQGSSQPYPTRDSTGAVTYSYIDATLSLTVTPQITPNGFIILDVVTTNNEVGASSGVAPPPISKQEITTNALVKDGETIVLGGIYRTKESDRTLGIPQISEIPLLGWLFKQESQDNKQVELMVFITPRIIEQTP
ncbi:MAG: type IV pilus secretin PilQ [Magnetococcales bacterium]|nr:type IV pilus secretin PilQ [Magnetococcales bacterium]